jgi:hypothetical protein
MARTSTIVMPCSVVDSRSICYPFLLAPGSSEDGRYRSAATDLPLSIPSFFEQNRVMDKRSETGAAPAHKNLLQWAMSPPQSYVVYLVALFLVAGASFYAGSLKPNKKSLVPPQSATQPTPPRN